MKKKLSKNGTPSNPNKPPVAQRTQRTANGVIRKGDRVPYRKASNEVIEQRVEQLVKYYQLHPFATRFDVHKRFCPKWKVQWDVVDRIYITRARKLTRERAQLNVNDAREKCLGVVMRHMDHPNPKIALLAVKTMAEITGIEAPKRTELTGPNGGPIQAQAMRPLVDISTEQLRQLVIEMSTEKVGANGK